MMMKVATRREGGGGGSFKMKIVESLNSPYRKLVPL